MTLGLFAMLIGSIIVEFTGRAFAELSFHDGNILLGIPLFVQGICVLDFLYRAPAKESHRRADADIYRTCCSISVCAVPAGAGRLL
ncbi:MAG: hypothetical protein R2881_05750 [Eubacteriales bacterium]